MSARMGTIGKALLEACLDHDLFQKIFCLGSTHMHAPPICTGHGTPEGATIIDHTLCSRSLLGEFSFFLSF